MAQHFDVIVVGGGISGAALFYELSKYTNVKKVALIEKYHALSTLNSKGTSNSQTIHSGDIETNYTYEKASKVKPNADMIVNYAKLVKAEEKFMFSHQKMALAVGEEECAFMQKRYEEFKDIYPYIRKFDKAEIKRIEPKVVEALGGGDRPEEIFAMGALAGDCYTTVDFGKMSESLAEEAMKANQENQMFFNEEIVNIYKKGDVFYLISANKTEFSANFVVVNAGAHSLFLAHKMGYGLDYACLPVAGSFYLTKKHLLNGKVYMVQNPKLPFAALHGDPDILCDMNTRFGPTALVLPKLERYHGLKSLPEFFTTLRLDGTTIKILLDLMKDSTIRNYILRNFLFEVPYLNKNLFVKDARKIVPSLTTDDITYAKGFGGVRPQVLNKTEKKLMLGEASIVPQNQGIIFNMTPSPGATSCMGNALRDLRMVVDYLKLEFNEELFNKELRG
ncbi:FAD-dependent oxidoreductase [Campylobacter sp. RM12640]|uniref:FAD-dependent oxidoreductase n=1 Tax=unclassified Campylobacter TaxID=2593542 RepID=UPI001BDAE5C4|nr:FAD-dependent oxidoreductase [Campylobacter sp. 2018MI13]MBZ7975759.1 FAD-dependent oxidoreductase [Campylobacter sp. RM12637]MBZ7977978.1 FAD-dependent oxidoreductase [Campylobacter sp. RM12654]MBZ7979698.1 FAD-dependent oxidoreductase [Campylobacter sp. RM12642]MBZ7981498.1 FAD-dependent oxidoreductase [Campylobacter sp. RM12640]MBZ7983584.1 FAD-dependent oxidoreductase [Campylobacter sp. RM12647]MBZ7989077.1 FAD-dependent oxidoreductase [Campylobacter sp. RM12635]MBZ7992348.1 FAD-depen